MTNFQFCQHLHTIDSTYCDKEFKNQQKGDENITKSEIFSLYKGNKKNEQKFGGVAKMKQSTNNDE